MAGVFDDVFPGVDIGHGVDWEACDVFGFPGVGAALYGQTAKRGFDQFHFLAALGGNFSGDGIVFEGLNCRCMALDNIRSDQPVGVLPVGALEALGFQGGGEIVIDHGRPAQPVAFLAVQ